MTRSFDPNSKIFTLKGILNDRLELGLSQLGSGSVADTITIHAINTTGIENVNQDIINTNGYYDLQGRQYKNLHRGLNIIREGNRAKKVFIK